MRALPRNNFLFFVICLCLAAPAHADIVLAVPVPLSGPVAGTGEAMRATAQEAAGELNSKGGILGEKVVLRFDDDGCDPTQAVTVANKIVADPPIAVIGHACSGATLAASPIYAEAGLPEITLSSNPKVTERGLKNIFRIDGRDDQQAPILARFLVTIVPKTGKLAVLDDKSAWGAGYADSLVTALHDKGRPIAWRDSITAGQKDFSAVISRLKNEGITNAVIATYTTEAALLIRQARDLGYKGNFYGGDPLQTPEFWKIAGPAAEGVRVSGVFDARATPAGQRLAEALKKKGIPVVTYGLYTYAAIETLAEAAEKAKSKKPEAIIAALRDGKFDTLLGPVSFDSKGDMKDYHFQIFVWHNGDYSLISEK